MKFALAYALLCNGIILYSGQNDIHTICINKELKACIKEQFPQAHHRIFFEEYSEPSTNTKRKAYLKEYWQEPFTELKMIYKYSFRCSACGILPNSFLVYALWQDYEVPLNNHQTSIDRSVIFQESFSKEKSAVYFMLIGSIIATGKFAWNYYQLAQLERSIKAAINDNNIDKR